MVIFYNGGKSCHSLSLTTILLLTQILLNDKQFLQNLQPTGISKEN